MGQLIDGVAKGDPLDPISIVAFANDNDAFKFVQQGFQLNGLTPVFQTQMRINDQFNYDRDGFAVFSYFNNGVVNLLSITELHSDLLPLKIGSYGAQLTLSRAQ
jgi:hypothetical protein